MEHEINRKMNNLIKMASFKKETSVEYVITFKKDVLLKKLIIIYIYKYL